MEPLKMPSRKERVFSLAKAKQTALRWLAKQADMKVRGDRTVTSRTVKGGAKTVGRQRVS
jgi:hypothetical protein